MITIILIVLVIGSAIFISLRPVPKPSSSPSLPPSIEKISPPAMIDVPYKPSTSGGGVDINSQLVQDSAREINKIGLFIPYQKEIKLSTGVDVSILIPGKELQINAWTLTIQVFGIDYRVTENDKDYEQMRKSFLEASKEVFSWMRSLGIAPEKIIISWGDRAFIQESAEKWLKSK